MVSLLSFFQERHGAGCLPLDTVPADALKEVLFNW